jgi:hypothetical protein
VPSGLTLSDGTSPAEEVPSEWVRDVLLSAPVESVPDSGEVALAEILARLSLLLNLHFRTAKGEPIPEPEMRALIDRSGSSRRAPVRTGTWQYRGTFPQSPNTSTTLPWNRDPLRM